MNRTSSHLLIIASLGMLAAGCHDATEEVEKDPPKLIFEGAPDAKYAGTWKTEDGVSTYIFDAKGTYQLSSKVQVKGQAPFQSHLSGQWAVKGDRMLFRDQAGNVSGYAYEFQGNKLTLTLTGALKAKTVMDREPPVP